MCFMNRRLMFPEDTNLTTKALRFSQKHKKIAYIATMRHWNTETKILFSQDKTMWSYIEINDTLQITTEQGFPVEILDLKMHQKNPVKLEDVQNRVFSFENKSKARIYHPAPTRCFLVQNIDGKRLYRGKIIITEQTIKWEKREEQITSGKYKIIQIYDPEYQKIITQNECPEGKNFFH